MKVKEVVKRVFNWELWPFYVLYAPIGPMWFWYCLRSVHSGFSVHQIQLSHLEVLKVKAKGKCMNNCRPIPILRTIYMLHDLSFENVKKKICEAGFNYPFIVKPDIGMKGILFRKIESEDQLEKYHHRIPVEYIVQELVEMPVEVSVFYYRYPAKKKG